MLTGLLKTFCWKAINISIFPTGIAGKTFICKLWSLINIFVHAIRKPPRLKQTWWKQNLYLQSDLTKAHFLLKEQFFYFFLLLVLGKGALCAKDCTFYPSWKFWDKLQDLITELTALSRFHMFKATIAIRST